MECKKSILYIANVQGPKIIDERTIKRNLSTAGNTKVFAIAKTLQESGHSVTIFSSGSVAERTNKIYLSSEEVIFTSNGVIHVIYGATIDNRILRNIFEIISAATKLPYLLKNKNVNTIIVYNITIINLIFGVVGKLLNLKVFLEYEDSVVAVRNSRVPWWKKVYRLHERLISNIIDGVFAPSFNLLKDIGIKNKLCLPGVLSADIIEIFRKAERLTYRDNSRLRLIYAGGLDESKAVDIFLDAMEQIDFPLEIHICGKGPLSDKINKLCLQSKHDAKFHGLLPRQELLQKLINSDVGISSHRSDFHLGGSWPFKVVEYLATCGNAFCNLSADIPDNLKKKLFLYHANDANGIAKAFLDFINKWPQLAEAAKNNREWAIEQYGPRGMLDKIERLLEERPYSVYP